MSNTDVFLSYRRKDVDFVKQIDQALRDSGRGVWVDWEDIPPGVEGFADEIQRGIESANAFIAILSPSYLESEYCLMELREALRLKKRIIPVVYKKFEPAPAPEGIGHINWVYFTPHAGLENTFEESFPKITKALEADYEHAREHTRLLLRTIDWEKNQRNRSYLLKGAEIDKAESWQIKASGKNPAPTETQLEYIVTGRKQQRKQQQQFTAIIGVLLAIAIAAAIYAVFQANIARINAEINQSNALASAALLPGNEDYAVALALEATRSEYAPQESFKVLTSVSYSIGGIRYVHKPDGYESDGFYLYPAVSPDGQFVVIKNRLYNLTTDTFILEFKNTLGILRAGLFMPDGKSVILAGDKYWWDDTADPVYMGLYDASTGELIQKFDTGIGVDDIQLSDDGKILISYQPDGKAIWWDVNTGEKLREFEYTYDIHTHCAFSPDLKWMAKSMPEGVAIYDTSTMEMQTTLPEYIGITTIVFEFSPDSKEITIYGGGASSTMTTYDVRSGKTKLEYSLPSLEHLGTHPGLHYSPDGKYLATTHYPFQQIYLWDRATGKVLKDQNIHGTGVLFAGFVKNSQQVVSMDDSGTVIEWDVLPGNVEKIIPLKFNIYRANSTKTLTQDGLYIITDGYEENQRFISVSDAKSLHEISRVLIPEGDYYVQASYYLNEGLEKGLLGYSIAEVSADGAKTTTTIYIASLPTGKTLHTFVIDGAIISSSSLQLSSNGKEFFVGYLSNDDSLSRLEKRDISTGKVIKEYIKPYSGNLAYTLSSDDALLFVSTTEYTLNTDGTQSSVSRLINAESGETVFTMDGVGVSDSFYFSPKNSEFISVISADQKTSTLFIRDATNGNVIRRFTIKTPISDLRFSPDGKSFFTSVLNRDGGGGTESPSGIPNSTSAATSGHVTQWDYATGKLIFEYPSQDAYPILSADGSTLITMDADRAVFWRLDTNEQLVTWACDNRYIPEFTTEQRERFAIVSEESICKSQ